MFQLFKSRTRLISGVIKPPQLDYIKRTFQERLEILRQYYRERTFYLRNDHILVRLLVSGLGSLKPSYEDFVRTATETSDRWIRHFQLTGNVNYGKIWYGMFYGEGSSEIIIGDNQDFDIDDAVKNWKRLSPVRVLTHAISDFGMTIPNGKNNHFVDGLSVIYINIPMLMLQYRRFIEDQRSLAALENQETVISPRLFLYRYVLPGMMPSHMDHVVVNRLMNFYDGAPMTESYIKSPFFQAEVGNNENSGIIANCNTAQEVVLNKITESQCHYDQILANIFTITEEDALDLLIMPDIPPTRQVWWAMLLARLKHMKFMVKVAKQNGSYNNRMYSNRLQIELSRLLDSRVLEHMLSADYLESTILDIQETIELTKD